MMDSLNQKSHKAMYSVKEVQLVKFVVISGILAFVLLGVSRFFILKYLELSFNQSRAKN